jgi:phage gpG-like protein
VADETRVELHGYRELERGSEQIFERIADDAPERFEGVADKAASVTRGRVPRRSGALAASVTSGRDDEKALVGMGGTGVPYAGWIEFGGTHGRPYIGRGRYLYPVAFSAEPVLVAAADKTAKDAIRRQRWPRPSL